MNNLPENSNIRMHLHLVNSAKGGIGKTLLTTLIAHKRLNSPGTAFVDLDASTQSLSQLVRFLEPNRLEAVSLLNNKGVLIRDKLVSYIESLVDSPINEIFIDCGSPESSQLVALEEELPLNDFLDMLNMTITYHVVVGGASSYIPSIQHLKSLHRVVNKKESIQVWASITTFNQTPELLKELEQNCVKMGITLRKFGDLDPQTYLGQQILNSLRLGKSLDNYSPGARLKMHKELSENINI